MISYTFSFANCLRHAFFEGAGYGDLERISAEDQRRWCSYDPPSVGSFQRMEIATEALPKHAKALADWVEAALQCKSWHWDADQYEAALHTLNDYRATVGEKPYEPWRCVDEGCDHHGTVHVCVTRPEPADGEVIGAAITAGNFP